MISEEVLQWVGREVVIHEVQESGNQVPVATVEVADSEAVVDMEAKEEAVSIMIFFRC